MKLHLFRYMRAFKGGADGKNLLKQVKEMKKHHRTAPALNPGPRGKYSRTRCENGLSYFHEKEDEDAEGEEDSESWDSSWVDEDGDEDGDEDEEEDVEEEGEVEVPDEDVVKGSVWRVVSDFIRSSTGELPYECEHFYLSDLLDHLAEAGQPESFLDYIAELMGTYTDIFAIKEDDVWIEHLCPAEALNAFEAVAEQKRANQ